MENNTSERLAPRVRLERLFDNGAFEEVNIKSDEGIGRGVICAYGKVQGRLTFVYSQDYTVKGGSLGQGEADKIEDIQKRALAVHAPVVALLESGGARIQEGSLALDGYGRIFHMNILSSGRLPQIAVVFGACAGGAAYSPALMDFIITVNERARMFITGPDVVKAVTGESVTAQKLGGAQTLARTSGISHFTAADDEDALNYARSILSYLPGTTTGETADRSGQIADLVPTTPKRSYDMRGLIALVADEGSVLEYMKDWGRNAVTAFARINGQAVAMVGNQPLVKAGCIDVDASDKMARFIRTADNMGLPIVTFVDTPGYMPGTHEEHSGIIRHGAKLLYAYTEAGVPKVTIIVRKAFGGAYIAMGSKSLGADGLFAYPFSQIAVMGAEGAMSIIARKELAAASNPQERLKELSAEYEKKFMHPSFSLNAGLIDRIITPEETRKCILDTLSKAADRSHKVHGNIPL